MARRTAIVLPDPRCWSGIWCKTPIRFPNVIVWFGLGRHDSGWLRERWAWFVRSSRLWRWLVPSVLGLLEAREKKVREEVTRLREEAERAQAALGEAERALQRLADARVTVAEVLAGLSRSRNRW